MNGYFGMTEYTFACENKIYGDMISWLSSYGIPYEGSIEYSMPGVKFRMITVKLKQAQNLIIRDINEEISILRSNKRWEDNHKG